MKSRDAMGEYLLAQYREPKRQIKEIVERDDGFIEATDYSDRYFSDYPTWDKSEKLAMSLVKGKTLDIGCGAGRHSLYLQKRGFDVTGMDKSPGAVKVSRLRGVKKVKQLPIEKVGSLTGSKFNTIIMMGNNFGLFGGPKKTKSILKQLAKITTSSAQIIAENNHPYKTTNPLHLGYHKLNRSRGRMPGQLKLRVRFQNIVGEWFDYLLVSPEEMKKILRDTGWGLKKVIPSQGTTYISIITKLG
jgi:SAM-dependent methyltransferase